MNDKEKVIKGLECCKSEKLCHSPCPYREECAELEDSYYGSKAIDDAIALLKEQEAELLQQEAELDILRNIYKQENPTKQAVKWE